MGGTCSRRHGSSSSTSATVQKDLTLALPSSPVTTVLDSSADSDDFEFIPAPAEALVDLHPLPTALRRQRALNEQYSGGHGRATRPRTADPLGQMPESFVPTPLCELHLPVQTLPAAQNFNARTLRVYAVWYIPGSPVLCGLHWSNPPSALAVWQGVRSLAYYAVAQAGHSGSEAWRSIRWERLLDVKNRDQAEARYLEEANRTYVHWFYWS